MIGPNFDQPVASDGYVWWYVDALSDDGQHGLTIIAFIGSVFSPYYYAARKRGPADPTNFVSLNVALYGRGPRGWSMTERGRTSLYRDRSWLTIGPSALSWDGATLTIRIDEIAVPLPKRLKGTVRVHPTRLVDHTVLLDEAGRHRWSPLAPDARVEVALDRPSMRWMGRGYLDSNNGDGPLEDSFLRWDWSRAALTRSTAVLYDVTRLDGSSFVLAREFHDNGEISDFAVPPAVALPSTLWRVVRGTRADPGAPVRVVETLEDSPFYARSVLSTHLRQQTAAAVHESLMLDRFSATWVRCLLPFRMPRIAR